ncbi:MAG: fibronectin type III domain-containing protein [Kiritimatiellae bacterium]|nr:fibronectin type III domain-containing protein [Kiritimatiellia bacterium]
MRRSVSKSVQAFTLCLLAAALVATAAPPRQHDRSPDQAFPPIGSQIGGSCTGWSTTYYGAGYVLAKHQGWNAKTGGSNYRASPVWAFNHLGNHSTGGSWLDNDNFMIKHGIGRWSQFYGDTLCRNLAYCTDPAVWRAALPWRMKTTKIISSVDTSTGLTALKTTLYDDRWAITMETHSPNSYPHWVWTTILDDPATTADDAVVGQTACSFVHTNRGGGHHMAIVGWNDDIWVDVNQNSRLDAGEKGALKIAESHGTAKGNNGFYWLAYDAIKAVSAVANGPKTDRAAAIVNGKVYCVQRRDSPHVPRLLAQFTLQTARRDEIRMVFHRTTIDDTPPLSPQASWTPELFGRNHKGDSVLAGFDGLNHDANPSAAPDGTFVFDLTDIAPSGDLTAATWRYVMQLTDRKSGRPVTLNAFKLIDATHGDATAVAAGLPMSVDNGTKYVWIDYPGNITPPPAAPDNLVAAAQSASRIRLTWRDNSSDETGFKIDRRRSGTDTWDRIAEPSANTTSHADSGLPAETHFYYQVKAHNAAGNSPYSNVATATTPTDLQPPAAPENLTATAVSPTRIDLSWTDNSDAETQFKIDRRRSGTDVWVRIASPTADATAYGDTGLESDTTYYYQVKAYNAAGNSPYSNGAAARTTKPADDAVPQAATWKYARGTGEASTPGHAWRVSGFDDSAWASGPAPFGYGDGPYGTTLSGMQNTYPSVFLRKAFDIRNAALVNEVRLWALYDDGFVMWLNGEEVARVNMPDAPGAPVACDGLAVNSIGPSEWAATLTGGALPELRTGANVLAVQVFNCALTSSDLTFDAQLSIVNSQLSIEADADRDGMPDAWETAYLSDLPDPSDRSDSADPDGDGLSNLAEYIAGTDPTAGAQYFGADVRLAGGRIVVSVPTIEAAGSGYTGTTRHYTLQARAEPAGEWRPLPGFENVAGTGLTLSYTNTSATGVTLYRARVWLE